MEFDPASGRPTFRLRPGPPGASEAIALARRLELPASWIARAEARVGPEHRALTRSLAELEATRQELAAATAEASRSAAESNEAAARYERERAALEAERRVTAKRLESELRLFREKVAGQLAREEARLRDELAAGRRRGVAAEATARLFAEAPRAPEVEPDELPEGGPIEVGSAVRHRGLGWSGTIERIDSGKARVVVGGKRLAAGLDELVRIGPAASTQTSQRAPRPVSSAADEPSAAAELKLLGFTVEDALDAVDEFLERAIRSERGEVRIVHGHGTGRLRDAIRIHLKKHPAVASARPGAPNEGGNGATVVELR